MGIDDHRRKAFDGPGRPVAAFDFDGTLTVRDSFRGFLWWRFGTVRLISGLLRVGPAAASRYAINRDRGLLKASLVAEFLGGWPIERVEADAERYAEAQFGRLMRPDALATWEKWGAEGAERIIVTASPESLVAPFARRLGADRLIGTRLALDASGRLTGALDGPNCRGAEKVVRLKAALGEHLHLTAAYGDTAGDREMLAAAAQPGYRVFKQRP